MDSLSIKCKKNHVLISHYERFCPLCTAINLNKLFQEIRNNLLKILKKKDEEIKELSGINENLRNLLHE